MNLLEKQIQRELTALDPDLFLDKMYFEGTLYYTVRYNVGLNEEPMTPVVWASPDGTPLPLSADIVSVVRMQEGNLLDVCREAAEINAQKRREAELEADLLREEIIHEFQFEGRHRKTSVNLGGGRTVGL